MENKKLAIAAVIMAPIIAIVGLVLSIVGVCKYPKSSVGRALSWAAMYISAANMFAGLLLALAIN